MADAIKPTATRKGRNAAKPPAQVTAEPLHVVTYEPAAAARSGSLGQKKLRHEDPDDVVRGGHEDDALRSGWSLSGWVRKVEDVPVDRLQKNLQSFLSTMGATLASVPNAIGAYRLDEIEIEVEVSAEGEVGLLGTGGKLGGKGSLTLKLTRT